MTNKIYMKNYAMENKDKIVAYRKKYYEDNRAKFVLRNQKAYLKRIWVTDIEYINNSRKEIMDKYLKSLTKQ